MSDTYLNWVISRTRTSWWHDSAEQGELDRALALGCVGVTTNPFLSNIALNRNRQLFAAEIDAVLAQNLPPAQKAEALMRIVVTACARKLQPIYASSQKRDGYVCAQVNPLLAGDRDAMLAMAQRLHAWAPNIAVKLPATSAGLDVEEECVAHGITVTLTVSFTVPQVLAIAERQRKGAERARANGIEPGKAFSVIMIGRLDDYLREVAQDNCVGVSESDIRLAGLAATKRAYQIYQQQGYEAVLLIAALRGNYHMTEVAGGNLIMSIVPVFQDAFTTQDFPREERIEIPVPGDAIERLRRLPEFIKGYEPDGMQPREFVGYGATQRTLSQFAEVGWKLIEGLK